ncbi:hypothetical protein GE061_003427 [Apolygus lucorum]|uniref:C2H2-type domain-containing protein n=1 Tax=Apolygus lucorum TaxID=248454 RepID=A0A8S9X631_APOLU|nr:hypothetical protein GE061_003427 [Apolygus lucorum]
MECSNKISEKRRQEIHRYFWDLPTWEQKRTLVAAEVSERPKNRSSIDLTRVSRRRMTRTYSLQVESGLLLPNVSFAGFRCRSCFKVFKYARNLTTHINYECLKEPRFECPISDCDYKTHKKYLIKMHVFNKHHMNFRDIGLDL